MKIIFLIIRRDLDNHFPNKQKKEKSKVDT